MENDGTPGAISFKGAECPLCSQWINHPCDRVVARANYFRGLKKAVDELVFFSSLKEMKVWERNRIIIEQLGEVGRSGQFFLQFYSRQKDI